ncbi:MAG: phospho-sugar mutase, partial [Acholeplasmataceae bacterium]
MNYKDNYNFWKSQNLIPELKKELDTLNEAQIADAFYQDLNFGTGGLRGIMGVGTNRINIYTISKATLGLANYLNKQGLIRGVAISYDNRLDSKKFAKQAAMVLARQGIQSFVFENLRPTPMLSFAVRYFKCDAGIMITASHNPKTYNGYKAYDKTGAQLNIETANQVIHEINQIKNPFDINTLDTHITYIDESFDDIYLKEVEKIKIYDEEKKVKIVYSPLHGTGGT